MLVSVLVRFFLCLPLYNKRSWEGAFSFVINSFHPVYVFRKLSCRSEVDNDTTLVMTVCTLGNGCTRYFLPQLWANLRVLAEERWLVLPMELTDWGSEWMVSGLVDWLILIFAFDDLFAPALRTLLFIIHHSFYHAFGSALCSLVVRMYDGLQSANLSA